MKSVRSGNGEILADRRSFETMTTDEKKQTLKKIFWDYNFSEAELRDILLGKISRAGHLDRIGLYSRLLSSLDWYRVLDLVGNNQLDGLLSDAVLNRIYPKSLQHKYVVAKRILFQ